MGSEEKSPPATPIDGWTLASFEPEDEYLQDMSHEDLQNLALKLKGYGEAADPRERSPRKQA